MWKSLAHLNLLFKYSLSFWPEGCTEGHTYVPKLSRLRSTRKTIVFKVSSPCASSVRTTTCDSWLRIHPRQDFTVGVHRRLQCRLSKTGNPVVTDLHGRCLLRASSSLYGSHSSLPTLTAGGAIHHAFARGIEPSNVPRYVLYFPTISTLLHFMSVTSYTLDSPMLTRKC